MIVRHKPAKMCIRDRKKIALNPCRERRKEHMTAEALMELGFNKRMATILSLLGGYHEFMINALIRKKELSGITERNSCF